MAASPVIEKRVLGLAPTMMDLEIGSPSGNL